MSLFVAGAVFGEVQVSLFVVGAVFGEIWNDKAGCGLTVSFSDHGRIMLGSAAHWK